MTKIIKILFAVLTIFAIIFIARIFIGGSEDDWICVNEEWVKHGFPNAPKPETGCGDTGKDDTKKTDLIRLTTPQPNQEIESPLLIEGEARGNWFFEGSFPVVLTNWDGLIIAESYATAQSDWMGADFVKFKTEIEFEKPELYNNGFLILRKDNPSGLPEYDDALEIPILFK